ncbi:MAG: MarR family transcriptional regulator [Clostridia bacterium]|nr:MarR family transcriptional regulator [Clostridia bacterium]MBR5679413.1 MarR family transcriptional regulator [Clostridia bacterium]
MNKKQIDILNDYFLHTALHLLTLEEQCLRKACSKDLSIRELHVLEAVSSLRGSGRNTMAEIARYLHLSPASLTTAVNVLVKKEFVTRSYSPVDRRVIYVELSESGEEANRKYLDFVRDMIRTVGRDLDEENTDAMIASIISLTEYLEKNAEA